MDRGYVVAVDHILGLELPVVIADIGLRARQHFEPVRRLIGKKINKKPTVRYILSAITLIRGTKRLHLVRGVGHGKIGWISGNQIRAIH